MKIHAVYTRNNNSFISRAIQWFTWDKEHPERNCSHVILKFTPEGGVFGDASEWWAFEAMERGVWPSPFERSLGKQTVVAEFEMLVPESVSREVMAHALSEYADWYYDYKGIGLWAAWLFAKRFFGTFVRLFKLVFNPKKAHKSLFCSGLLFRAVKYAREIYPQADLGMTDFDARTSNPVEEVEECMNHPKGWKLVGGLIHNMEK